MALTTAIDRRNQPDKPHHQADRRVRPSCRGSRRWAASTSGVSTVLTGNKVTLRR